MQHHFVGVVMRTDVMQYQTPQLNFRKTRWASMHLGASQANSAPDWSSARAPKVLQERARRTEAALGRRCGAPHQQEADARPAFARYTSRRTPTLGPPTYDQIRNVQSVDVDTNSVSAGSKQTPCTASSWPLPDHKTELRSSVE